MFLRSGIATVVVATVLTMVAPAYGQSVSYATTDQIPNYRPQDNPQPPLTKEDFLSTVSKVSSMDWSQAPFAVSGRSTGSMTGQLGSAVSHPSVAPGSPLVMRACATVEAGKTMLGMRGQTLWFGVVTAQKRAGSGVHLAECFWEIYTATPGPTLRIRHGVAIACSHPWMRGRIFSGLGETSSSNGQLQVRGLDPRGWVDFPRFLGHLNAGSVGTWPEDVQRVQSSGPATVSAGVQA
jgi:hypothetical protein